MTRNSQYNPTGVNLFICLSSEAKNSFCNSQKINIPKEIVEEKGRLAQWSKTC